MLDRNATYLLFFFPSNDLGADPREVREREKLFAVVKDEACSMLNKYRCHIVKKVLCFLRKSKESDIGLKDWLDLDVFIIIISSNRHQYNRLRRTTVKIND